MEEELKEKEKERRKKLDISFKDDDNKDSEKIN